MPYEPWRLPAPRRQGPRFGVRKVLLVAVAGVVAVGVVAAAVIVFVTRDGGSTDRDEESRLAGGVFTGDPAVTADGRDQELTGVAAAGSTVVAVGGETDHLTQRAQFLVSTDAGRSFRLAPTRSTSGEEPPPGDVLRHVATSSRGWVAIGDRLGGTVVWISRDGRIWTRRPDAAGAPFGSGTQVNRVAGTAGGFIAVGATSRKRDFSDSVPALWLSEDGRNWERRVGDQLGLSAGGGTLSLVDATANGGTILIQGVHTRRPGARNPDARNMVWRSEDAGRSWTESKIRAPKGTMGLSIGGGPAGFVAVREIRDGAGAYAQPFTSDDGKTWTQADKIAVSGHRRVMRLLASDQWQFAVVDAAGRAVLVRGRPGEPWQEAGTMPMAPGRSLLSAAVTGDTTIVAGRDLAGRDINAILTVSAGGGPPTGIDLGKVPGAVREDQVVRALSAPGADGSGGGGRAVAVGGTNGDAAAWTSTDGTKWRRARPEGDAFARPGRQRLGDVASGRAGWLAVGSDGVSPVRPLVVTSADGMTWKTSAGADVFQPRQGVPLATNAAAAAQPGYVVVGEDGTTAAAWFSADLRTWEKGVAAGRDAPGGPGTWMRGVTGGPFGFVAAGGRRDPAVRGAPNARPAIWASADGRRWAAQPLPLPSGFTEGSLEYVAAKDRLLVAAGTAATPEGPRPLAYMSADGGRTWQETKIPGDGRAVVSAMTATPNGFLAAGTSGAPGTGDAVLWTSRDGRAWQPLRPRSVGLSGAGEQELTGLTVLGGRLIGVGATRSHRGESPTLWHRPIL